MLDLWEIMGRLVTDNHFRRAVYNGRYASTYPPAFAGGDATKPTQQAVIPQADYQTLRAIVSLKIGGPVSLMALGEVLWTMTTSKKGVTFPQSMDDLANKTRAAFANLKPPVDPSTRNSGFFIALGVLMMDARLRHLFVTGDPAFDDYGLDGLMGSDREMLRTILAPGDNDVAKAAEEMCRIGWDPDCYDLLVDNDRQTHPVANW